MRWLIQGHSYSRVELIVGKISMPAVHLGKVNLITRKLIVGGGRNKILCFQQQRSPRTTKWSQRDFYCEDVLPAIVIRHDFLMVVVLAFGWAGYHRWNLSCKSKGISSYSINLSQKDCRLSHKTKRKKKKRCIGQNKLKKKKISSCNNAWKMDPKTYSSMS